MIYVCFNRFRKTKGKGEISHERSLTPGVNESLVIKAQSTLNRESRAARRQNENNDMGNNRSGDLAPLILL